MKYKVKHKTKTRKMEIENRENGDRRTLVKKKKGERNKKGQNAYGKSRTHYRHILSHRNRKRREIVGFFFSPRVHINAATHQFGHRCPAQIYEYIYIIKWNLLIV